MSGAGRSTLAITHVADADQFWHETTEAICSARREVLATLPTGPYPAPMLREHWQRDAQAIDRGARSGIRTTIVYAAPAGQSPDVLRYLGDCKAAGARIRVTPHVAQRMMLVDRERGFLAVNENAVISPFLRIHEPALLRQLCIQFKNLWHAAHRTDALEDDSTADTVRETLEVLARGDTDCAAAHKLGVSERTLRRRVSAAMEVLDAGSRFELGVQAARNGWI